VNAVALDLEAVSAHVGPRDFVEARVFQVEDVAAPQADEVMMLVQLGIEARRRAGVADLGQEAEGDECPQNAMHRHPGDLGKFGADRPVNLFSGGVVSTDENGFEDGLALGGDRQATLAMGGEEAVEALLFFRWVHVLNMNICTR
jgi:hypothetical protein